MGTALTERQLRELGRLAAPLFLCFDADAAGEAATLRGMDLAAGQGFDVRVVALPPGLDPADAAGEFEAFLERAEAYPVYRVRIEIQNAPDRNAAYERARETLDRLPESPERQDAWRYANDKLGMTVQIRAAGSATGMAGTAVSPRLLAAGERLERDALAGCLEHPELLPSARGAGAGALRPRAVPPLPGAPGLRRRAPARARSTQGRARGSRGARSDRPGNGEGAPPAAAGAPTEARDRDRRPRTDARAPGSARPDPGSGAGALGNGPASRTCQPSTETNEPAGGARHDDSKRVDGVRQAGDLDGHAVLLDGRGVVDGRPLAPSTRLREPLVRALDREPGDSFSAEREGDVLGRQIGSDVPVRPGRFHCSRRRRSAAT